MASFRTCRRNKLSRRISICRGLCHEALCRAGDQSPIRGPENARLSRRGWHLVGAAQRKSRGPAAVSPISALGAGEFTAIKGVDVRWRTGVVSSIGPRHCRPLGRPVITEETARPLSSTGKRVPVRRQPRASRGAARRVLLAWPRLSTKKRATARWKSFDLANELGRYSGLEAFT